MKGRTQYFVPLDDREPGALEEVRRNAPFEAPADRHVVRRIAGIQPVEQPEAFLRHRTGEIRPLVRRLGIRGQRAFAHRRFGRGGAR
jgi:hypothetical protein